MIESWAPRQGGPTHNGVREFVHFLSRRKLIILAPTILITATTWLVISATAPRYAAEADLALDARKVQIVEHEVVSGLPQESPVIRTELDVITSRSLIQQVIDRLGLETDPDFLREVGTERSPLQNFIPTGQQMLARLLPGIAGAGPVGASDAVPPLTRSHLTDWLIDHLKVSNDGRSFTIVVSYTSEDPKRAAQIANAIAEDYLADQVQTKVKATAKANEWLAEKLSDLRRELQTSEAAVDDFRRQSGLIEAKGASIPAQRLTELNLQLVNAHLERARAEAKLQTAREGDPATIPNVIASPVIQQLHKDIAQIDSQIAEQRYHGVTYKENVLDARAAALWKQISLEGNRILASLLNDVQAARKREAELTRLFHHIEEQLGDTTRSATRLNELQREADANRSIYETFLARYKQTMEQEGLEAPDARLISQADPPRFPNYPKTLQLLVLGTLGGLAAGVALGYVREGFDRRVRQVSDVGAVTGIPVFGLLPRVSRWRRLPPQDYPVSKPRSRFCTSLVRIHAVLQAPRSPVSNQVILVTSAKAGEGKTSFCTGLARSLATNLTRVLVIDADPYRPRVAAAFGASTAPNFGSIIEQRAQLSDLVQTDTKSTADFIAAPNEHDMKFLLHSGGFATLIEEARRAYDVVILDTPPVMTSADAAVVGRFADTCLFLVRWDQASWDEVTSTVGFLRLCGIKPDGIVMVGVDARSAHYGHVGGYGGYHTVTSDDHFIRPPIHRRVTEIEWAAAAGGSEGV
jgi:polysaccharide biosynthesis transport protein